MSNVVTLKPFINGEYVESTSSKYMDVFNPSTGEVLAKTPCCTQDEVLKAVAAAKAAFPAWAATPAIKRAQIMYKVRELIVKYMDELTLSVATENGKVLSEAQGDVLKAKEVTELACGVPTLMMGESTMNASSGYDTVLYREPIGVFAGKSAGSSLHFRRKGTYRDVISGRLYSTENNTDLNAGSAMVLIPQP